MKTQAQEILRMALTHETGGEDRILTQSLDNLILCIEAAGLTEEFEWLLPTVYYLGALDGAHDSQIVKAAFKYFAD